MDGMDVGQLMQTSKQSMKLRTHQSTTPKQCTVAAAVPVQ